MGSDGQFFMCSSLVSAGSRDFGFWMCHGQKLLVICLSLIEQKEKSEFFFQFGGNIHSRGINQNRKTGRLRHLRPIKRADGNF
jgi:hypothetical protein